MKAGCALLESGRLDPLILKLRKAKRCKDAAIAKLSIDVVAALESVDGLPNRWWYAIERLDKSGRQKEEVFLQITVTVDGREVKKDPAKPAEEPASTAAQQKSQTTQELKANLPPSASTTGPADSQPAAASTSDTSDEPTTKREDKPSHERRSSVSQDGEVGTGRSNRRAISPSCAAGDVMRASSPPPSSPPASFDTSDKPGTSGHGEGDVKKGPGCHHFRDKDGEVSEVHTAADCHTCTGNIDHGRGQDPAKSAPFKETSTAAAQEVPVSGIHQKEMVTLSTDVDNDSERRQAKSTSPKKTMEQEMPETLVDPKDALTEMYLKNLKRILAQRDFPQYLVPRYAWMIEGMSKDTESERPATSDTDTDGPGESASSTQGGGVSLTPDNTHPRNKGTDDPEFEKMMHAWSIEDLWDKFTKMRKSADELLAYAESLRSKLSAAVPHVLAYPLIKNLIAHVPERTSYVVPDTEGMSLQDLQAIEDTLAKLLKEEKSRATYLRERFIDELCSVAMNEAPQVLSKEA
uniref:Uncharacterized protein n=1 Tax=Branchiostoma floridae TaxID=7739 RepID=C3ZD87_BRAFL|eukprot:XP_002593431.1 hypothetical protein BRAFLDRAFT_70789 [Branchiostoma floridae]